MSTSPPVAMARLVVDTDVASFIFKWHPEFAPQYIEIIRGSELILSFMTLAEMRQGAPQMRCPGSLSGRLTSFRLFLRQPNNCQAWSGRHCSRGHPASPATPAQHPGSAPCYLDVTSLKAGVPVNRVHRGSRRLRNLSHRRTSSVPRPSGWYSATTPCRTGVRMSITR